ncbi:hypothetical protein CHS0354_026954, partial [Potamilus streckersoni]
AVLREGTIGPIPEGKVTPKPRKVSFQHIGFPTGALTYQKSQRFSSIHENVVANIVIQ